MRGEKEDTKGTMKNCILHAILKNNKLVLTGTVMADEGELLKSDSVSIMMQCDTLAEMQHFYEKLANGSRKTQPMERTFRGAWFGGLTDKFGTPWLLTCQRPV